MVHTGHPEHAPYTYVGLGHSSIDTARTQCTIMTMTMSGPLCPHCGHDGPHPIMAYEITEEGYPILNVLHCNKCEEVWEERLRHI